MAVNGYEVPRMPRGGERLKVSWGDSLVRAMTQLRPVQVPDMLISRGMYGTRYAPLASSSRAYPSNFGSLLPFTVRWLVHDRDEDTGEWQIYIPLGCLTLTQGDMTYFYLPTNDAAKDAEGNDIADWYRIPDPEDTAYANVVSTKKRVVTTWSVFLALKPWPRVHVSTDPTDFAPVAWRIPVAEMCVTEYADDTPTKRTSVRLIEETQIEKVWDITKPFSIRYDIAAEDIKKKSATPTAMLTNQMRFVGRLQTTLVDDTDVTGWPDVWVKIVHDGETFEMSVEHALSGADAQSDDDQTVYRIYALDNDVVELDLRDAVPAMDFYTSPATAEATGSAS